MRTPRSHATEYRSDPEYCPIYHLGWLDLIVPRCTNYPSPTDVLPLSSKQTHEIETDLPRDRSIDAFDSLPLISSIEKS